MMPFHFLRLHTSFISMFKVDVELQLTKLTLICYMGCAYHLKIKLIKDNRMIHWQAFSSRPRGDRLFGEQFTECLTPPLFLTIGIVSSFY